MCSRPLPRSAPAPSPPGLFPAALFRWSRTTEKHSQRLIRGDSCVYRELDPWHLDVGLWHRLAGGWAALLLAVQTSTHSRCCIHDTVHRPTTKRRSASIMTLLSLASPSRLAAKYRYLAHVRALRYETCPSARNNAPDGANPDAQAFIGYNVPRNIFVYCQEPYA